MRDAVICEPVRTPIGRFGGALRDVPVTELAATVIRELLRRTGIPRALIEDVYGTAGGAFHPVPGGMLETAENLRREYRIAVPSRTS